MSCSNPNGCINDILLCCADWECGYGSDNLVIFFITIICNSCFTPNSCTTKTLYLVLQVTPVEIKLVNTDPDMTTLVTLEVHSPGDNDSVSLVPVRIRLFLKHACALIVGTGDSSLTVYNPDTFVYIPDTFDKSYRAFYFMITYCFTVYNPDIRVHHIRVFFE